MNQENFLLTKQIKDLKTVIPELKKDIENIFK